MSVTMMAATLLRHFRFEAIMPNSRQLPCGYDITVWTCVLDCLLAVFCVRHKLQNMYMQDFMPLPADGEISRPAMTLQLPANTTNTCMPISRVHSTASG